MGGRISTLRKERTRRGRREEEGRGQEGRRGSGNEEERRGEGEEMEGCERLSTYVFVGNKFIRVHVIYWPQV